MTNIRTENFTPEEIKELRDRAYKEYYFRSEYVGYKIKQAFTNPTEFSRMIKGGFHFLKYLST